MESKCKDEVVTEPKCKDEVVTEPKCKDEVVKDPKCKDEVVTELKQKRRRLRGQIMEMERRYENYREKKEYVAIIKDLLKREKEVTRHLKLRVYALGLATVDYESE